jgi:hypothetical protein
VDTNTAYVASISELNAAAVATAFQLVLPTTNGVPLRTALYTSTAAGTVTTASIQLTGATTLGCTSYNVFLMDMTVSTGALVISKQTFTTLPQVTITFATQVFKYAIKTPAFTTGDPAWTPLQGSAALVGLICNVGGVQKY